jgi:hypothetical protein
VKFARAEYASDVAAYGPIRQQSFFDIMLELIGR